jgi:phosphoglycolate phosphatase
MYIATSKRRDFAERVIDHLALRPYVKGVYGALPGGGLDEKYDLLAHILATEDLRASDAIMVGDRLHDMHAAQRNDIRGIGVLWGYGGREELMRAGAAAIAAHPSEVARLVLGG